MSKVKQSKKILGLDLGSNSLGWALIEYDQNSSGKIIDNGVRVFEAGMKGDIERGKAESRNKKRRENRLTRRQYNRRRRRKLRLVLQLKEAGLLPLEFDLTHFPHHLIKENTFFQHKFQML